MAIKRKRENSEQVATSAMADSSNSLSQVSEINNEPTPSPRKFKCQTCNMEFAKFQALGGHRASHKKPVNLTNNGQESESKMHECPICGARFFIGQALGGHMRKHQEVLKEAKANLARTKHRVAHDEASATREAESVSDKPESERERLRLEKSKRRKVNLSLDLNLTPREDGA